MKICWDNLEDVYLTKNGNLKKGGTVYIEKEKCKLCGAPYLTSLYQQADYCGRSCEHTINLLDKRFGRLIVKKYIGVKKAKSVWECECDCGKIRTVSTGELTSGNTKSCGCLRSDNSRNMCGEKHPNYIDGRMQDAEHKKRYMIEYYNNNKSVFFANEAKRRAMKLNQTPDNANLQKIQLYYTICAYLNKPCEIPMWHVDHIQPISKGGLHHEDNLQILTAELNSEKRAKYPLTKEEKIKYKGIKI